MAPGATKLGDNRFSLLSPIMKKKRKKPNPIPLDQFPELPVSNTDDPKFLVMSSLDDNKPLNSSSCFATYKGIQAISKEVSKVTELRDGSLLLFVNNNKTASKFLSAKILPGGGHINVKLHNTLNTVKGTIYAPFLNNLSEEDIVDGLKEQGVSAVHKFSRIADGSRNPTGVVLLTFDKYKLPERIDVAWRNLTVRPYYPNPMRCKQCQLIGHTAKYCRNSPSCVSCNLPSDHTPPTECKRIMCANCSGDHPASSNTCPKYQQSKEILKIKTIYKCSMREAVTKYKIQFSHTTSNANSFASIAKISNNTNQINNETTPNNKSNNPTKTNLTTTTDINSSKQSLPTHPTSSSATSPSPLFSPLSISDSPLNILSSCPITPSPTLSCSQDPLALPNFPSYNEDI